MKSVAFYVMNLDEGGGQRVVSELANEMQKQGMNVYILLGSDTSTNCYNICKGINIVELKEWFHPNPSQMVRYKKKIFKFCLRIFGRLEENVVNTITDYFVASKCLADYLNKKNIAAVFSNLVWQNIPVGLATKRFRGKTVVCEGNFPDREGFSNWFKSLRDYSYRRASVCIFQTESQKNCFPSYLRKKGIVIGNPIMANLPLPFKGNRKKVITNFCGLRPEKNLFLLIEAFSIVHRTYPDYQLVIYGDGPLREELERYVKELNLWECIFLRHYSSGVHELISDSSMFVSSSDSEGLSNSLLEAMAIGLPVISTDCLGGGARSVIENKKNGIIVPIKDESALANAIIWYIEHPDKANEFSLKAAEKVNALYNIEYIAKQWLRLI